MAEEYFHVNKKTKVDFDENEDTDESDNDTDCLVSDSDRDSDTIEEDKIILKNRRIFHAIRRTTATMIQKKFEEEIGQWKKITKTNIIEKLEEDTELKNVCARAELTVGRLRAFVDMFQMTRLKN
ncbi:hypothetical protein AOXY_G30480 [Acipenser oxyrinchus oxyrinchus]|uniref:Uncharacterized protein n=1 Tax=Acipenser oxyrinchus oxyrinchus TaxID=40147 RepID=A0AAD8CLF5_ACIOX|nr:hypothetical protein AOXY_G30480 [Acipenser oxyrinchus oxyrinchus]